VWAHHAVKRSRLKRRASARKRALNAPAPPSAPGPAACSAAGSRRSARRWSLAFVAVMAMPTPDAVALRSSSATAPPLAPPPRLLTVSVPAVPFSSGGALAKPASASAAKSPCSRSDPRPSQLSTYRPGGYPGASGGARASVGCSPMRNSTAPSAAAQLSGKPLAGDTTTLSEDAHEYPHGLVTLPCSAENQCPRASGGAACFIRSANGHSTPYSFSSGSCTPSGSAAVPAPAHTHSASASAAARAIARRARVRGA
jgi:hypothetical protein